MADVAAELRRPEIDTRSAVATEWLGAVLVPWLVSRAAVDVAAHGAAMARHKPGGFAAFWVWDGGWYVKIARGGYGFTDAFGQTPYPFFPLFPFLLRTGVALGVTPFVFGVVLNHVVFLLALWGVYVITREHCTPAAALAASWSLALFPGSAPLTALYADGIVLACGVWSFVAVERRRDAAAAVLAAIAALARPNGILLALALAVAAFVVDRSPGRAARVALPAVGCLLAWLIWLGATTGDPLIFIRAKSAWREITLDSLLRGRDAVPMIDLAFFALAIGACALSWRHLPAAWLVLAGASLLPSLALGIQGMPRYAAACFPVAVAQGIILARVPAVVRVAMLALSGAGLLFMANRIFLRALMP